MYVALLTRTIACASLASLAPRYGPGTHNFEMESVHNDDTFDGYGRDVRTGETTDRRKDNGTDIDSWRH